MFLKLKAMKVSVSKLCNRLLLILTILFEQIRELFILSKFYGQATKGIRWMPWRVKAMKDVASCDKLR